MEAFSQNCKNVLHLQRLSDLRHNFKEETINNKRELEIFTSNLCHIFLKNR